MNKADEAANAPEVVFVLTGGAATRVFTAADRGARLDGTVELRDQFGARWVVPTSMLVRRLVEPKPFGAVVRASGSVWTKVDRGGTSRSRTPANCWAVTGDTTWSTWEDGPGADPGALVIWLPPVEDLGTEVMQIVEEAEAASALRVANLRKSREDTST